MNHSSSTEPFRSNLHSPNESSSFYAAVKAEASYWDCEIDYHIGKSSVLISSPIVSFLTVISGIKHNL